MIAPKGSSGIPEIVLRHARRWRTGPPSEIDLGILPHVLQIGEVHVVVIAAIESVESDLTASEEKEEAPSRKNS